ncbi:MAG: right-handed parallel beta-helix repeat-containing protein, partial [Verrucomicrobia bacterium]|nr:right-handed parallel beta-helix repeat-containing protein [Verrucomicrobiota bacterium]
STVIGCVSVGHGDDGIEVGTGSSVSSCTVSGNADDGIAAGDGCIITANASSGNTGDGVQVANDCQVVNNNCDGNGVGAAIGAGIHATGADNSIENNNLTDADRGLDIAGAGNVIANNTVRRNTVNYNIAAGNQLNLLLGQIPQTISWSCNVLLAGALTGTSANNGITIAANDVTIDLGGHALIGVSGSLDGVSVSGSRTNITVRNGALRAWGSDGVQASTAYNSQFADLKVASCGANGIQAGLGSSVKACSTRANGADGITTSSGCNITDCTAAQNKSDGIVANSGSAVTGCNAFDNVATGISASTGSTVMNSTAYSNTNGIVASSGSTVTGCTVSSNGTNGIVTAFGATVTGCTCRANKTNINVGDDSRIVDNTCDQDLIGSGTGILINGSDNRIDGNHVTDNAIGIDCNSTGNLIIRNTAAGNTTAYSINAGNNYGAILTSPGTAFAASNPWNNFSY